MHLPHISLIVGSFLDGRPYPGPTGEGTDGSGHEGQVFCRAVIDRVVLGRNGYLSQLEAWFGLPEHVPCEGLRVARCFRAAGSLIGKKGEGPFYAGSYRTDPWVTALHLRAFLDDLLLAGWKGRCPSEGGRLEDLSKHWTRIGRL